jgi:hypothetical protein
MADVETDLRMLGVDPHMALKVGLAMSNSGMRCWWKGWSTIGWWPGTCVCLVETRAAQVPW